MSKKSKKQKKKEEQKRKKTRKFTPMSKLIGFITIMIALSIIVFTMYEMHRIQDISSIQYLIVGGLGLLATYVGFYINMAKAEHLEDKRNELQKELELIRKDGITEDEKEREQELKTMLENLNANIQELHSKEETKYQ